MLRFRNKTEPHTFSDRKYIYHYIGILGDICDYDKHFGKTSTSILSNISNTGKN